MVFLLAGRSIILLKFPVKKFNKKSKEIQLDQKSLLHVDAKVGNLSLLFYTQKNLHFKKMQEDVKSAHLKEVPPIA